MSRDQAAGSTSAWRGLPFLVGACLMFFVWGMELTAVAAALPSIAAHLRPASLYGWVPAAYLLAEVVGTPLAARVVSTSGLRPVLVASIGLFALGAIGSAMAPSMGALVVCSAVQGAGMSGGYIALVAAMSSGHATAAGIARAQGIAVGVFGVGHLAGPVVAEAMLRFASWRELYWLEVPLAAASFLLLVWQAPETDRRERRRMDVAGTAVLVLLGGLLCADAIGVLPSLAVYPAAVALLPIGYWIEKRQRDPLVPRLLLCDRRVFSAALVLVAGEALAACFVTFFPLFAALLFGRPEAAGRVLFPAVLGRAIASMMCGALANRWSVRAIASIGISLSWSSCAALVLLPFGWLSFVQLGVIVLVLGFGLGLVYTPVLVAVQAAVDERDLGSATAFESFLSATSGVLVVGAMSGALAQLLGWRAGEAPEALAVVAGGSISDPARSAYLFFWAVLLALASLALAFSIAGRRVLGGARGAPIDAPTMSSGSSGTGGGPHGKSVW